MSEETPDKLMAALKIAEFKRAIAGMFSTEPSRRMRVFLSSILSGYGINEAETRALDKKENLDKY